MTTVTQSLIKYSSIQYLTKITIWLDVDTQKFGFAVNGKPSDCPFNTQRLAEKASRTLINKLKKTAVNGTIHADLIKS